MKSKLDQFQFIKKIGQGSFSEVHLVKRHKDNKQYAAKKIQMNELTQKEKINALNEIRLLASIKNNNIIQYKESFFDDESKCLFLILEYANQGDIQSQIIQHKKKNTKFQEDQIWCCLIDMLIGLNYLHTQDICHRDIKSGNVFIQENNIYKLGDFNVSKIQKNKFNYTQIGTPFYAAPEIWKNQPYDSKSDIWSLGCLIYEMAALITPFNAYSKESLYKKVIKGDYDPIPDNYSNDLHKVINSCLRLNPKIRLSADELLQSFIIKKKIKQLRNNYTQENQENMKLLQTIKLPTNINNLDNNLPKSNYDKNFREIFSIESYETPILKVKKQIVKNQSVYDFSDIMLKEKNLIDHLSPGNKIKEINQSPSIFSLNQQYKNKFQQNENLINVLLLR